MAEVGYGMWGMGGWTGSNDDQSRAAIDRAIALGCNFFDTALAYGQGHSERLLGQALRHHQGARPFVATKVPPKNMAWPGRASTPVADVFPPDHIRAATERSLQNLGLNSVDLQQLHVWSDAWAADEGWKRAVADLKREGLIRGFGISVNRWEPANVLAALETGLVDAVQVVYNLFDQAPEDELFPACERLDVAVIARVPFDEGSLTGTLTADTTFPDNDWRSIYFTPENLRQTLARVEAVRPQVPEGWTLPDLALRYILQHRAVSTTIPGMRRPAHVEANLAVSDGRPLTGTLHASLRAHRWDRTQVIP